MKTNDMKRNQAKRSRRDPQADQALVEGYFADRRRSAPKRHRPTGSGRGIKDEAGTY